MKVDGMSAVAMFGAVVRFITGARPTPSYRFQLA